jgi:hypothetical protein
LLSSFFAIVIVDGETLALFCLEPAAAKQAQ